jgi:hypothetical protein
VPAGHELAVGAAGQDKGEVLVVEVVVVAVVVPVPVPAPLVCADVDDAEIIGDMVLEEVVVYTGSEIAG